MVSSTFAVGAFLCLVLFSAQLLTNLHATSALTAVGTDAARRVAAQPAPGEQRLSTEEATERLREQLGRFGDRVTVDWSGSDSDTVRLRLRARTARLAPLGVRLPFTTIDRTITVRVERYR